jgi:hypothetical protein
VAQRTHRTEEAVSVQMRVSREAANDTLTNAAHG